MNTGLHLYLHVYMHICLCNHFLSCSYAAAAELCDTAESHETQTVLLNQQLADMAVKLTGTQKVEAQLRTECEELGTQLHMAKKQMEEDSQKIEELLMSNAELESTKVSAVSSLEEQEARLLAECQSLREQLDSAVEGAMKLAQEKEGWEREQTSGLAKCTEMGQVRTETEALREMVASLTAQREALEREREEMLSHHESEVQHLGIQRADAVMEAELLQQRISELTTEKSEVEERVEELQLVSGDNSEKGRCLSPPPPPPRLSLLTELHFCIPLRCHLLSPPRRSEPAHLPARRPQPQALPS